MCAACATGLRRPTPARAPAGLPPGSRRSPTRAWPVSSWPGSSTATCVPSAPWLATEMVAAIVEAGGVLDAPARRLARWWSPGRPPAGSAGAPAASTPPRCSRGRSPTASVSGCVPLVRRLPGPRRRASPRLRWRGHGSSRRTGSVARPRGDGRRRRRRRHDRRDVAPPAPARARCGGGRRATWRRVPRRDHEAPSAPRRRRRCRRGCDRPPYNSSLSSVGPSTDRWSEQAWTSWFAARTGRCPRRCRMSPARRSPVSHGSPTAQVASRSTSPRFATLARLGHPARSPCTSSGTS